MTDFSRVKQNLEARGFRVSVFATAAEAAEATCSAPSPVTGVAISKRRIFPVPATA